MSPERFARLVEEAVAQVPGFFRERLDNIQVEARAIAPPELASGLGAPPMNLLGTYQGIPYKSRGPWYGNVMPDRILLFQRPIEARCRTEDEVRALVREVVIHELGHYFGLSDEELHRLAAEHPEKPEGRPRRPSEPD